jgi:anaerobic dimethyl sulfoxide reductase subunit B (iron-sulfur subunit)
MVQYGFFFDQNRCMNCHTCSVACRDWNDIPAGPVKWARMFEWEKGSFPNITLNYLFAPCYHCQDPVCVDAANGAMYKEEKYGAVLIDPDKANSIDLRKANEACPYGAIQFDSDAMDATASKCTMCIDRLEQGLQPSCALSCPVRALDFGPLEDLQKKYGTLRDIEDVPDSNLTKPAVVFKLRQAKKQLVPYNTNKALQLMAQRPSGLPAFFNTNADVTDVPDGLVGRGRLVMRARNVAEQAAITQHDEG